MAKSFLKLNHIKVLLTLLCLQFFSCDSNIKEVQKSVLSEFKPNGESKGFNVKYTLNGKIKSIIISQKMLDYTSVKFPFTEFPDGINVTLYDDNAEKTYVVSKYAVKFKKSDLIDLRGSVKITNDKGQMLETDQLYFDQKNEWFFTEKRYKFTDPKGVSFGEGLDFSKDFKIINSQQISGKIKS